MFSENLSCVDYASGQHLFFGCVWMWMLGPKSLLGMMCMHLAYELQENLMSGQAVLHFVGFKDYEGDSFQNSLSDNLIAWCGYILVAWLHSRQILHVRWGFLFCLYGNSIFLLWEIINRRGVASMLARKLVG